MPAVWARSRHIILQYDSTPFDRPNQCRIHISHQIRLCSLGGMLAKLPAGISRQPRFTRRHGYKILHAVSTMNIHPLTDRTQPVSGIRISGMLLAIQLYPVIMIAAFRFVGKVMPAEVMDICSFGMGYLSQCPLPHHVQGRQGKSIITTVLQHHAVPACLLGGIHQTPAVRHAHGGRHLKGGMASLLHGIYRNIGMCQPIGTNINQVNIRTSAQLPPSAFFAIGNSRRTVETVEQRSGTLYIPGRKSHRAFTSTPSRCIYRSRAKIPYYPAPQSQCGGQV